MVLQRARAAIISLTSWKAFTGVDPVGNMSMYEFKKWILFWNVHSMNIPKIEFIAYINILL